MKVAAIVPSAGIGSRLKSNIQKPYIKIGNKPILAHTLQALSNNKSIVEILVSVGKDKLGKARKEIIERYGIKKARLVAGGKTRGESVYNALKAVSKDADYILIHDGIRPFIAKYVIDDLLKDVVKSKAAVACVPVKATLKIAGKDLFIKATPPRDCYWEAQTPQVFKRELIEKAYRLARKKRITATDDSALVEMIGVKPKIIMGSYSNIKITTNEDLELAKLIIKKGI